MLNSGYKGSYSKFHCEYRKAIFLHQRYKTLKIVNYVPLVVELKNNLIKVEFCSGMSSNFPKKRFLILKSILFSIFKFSNLLNCFIKMLIFLLSLYLNKNALNKSDE